MHLLVGDGDVGNGGDVAISAGTTWSIGNEGGIVAVYGGEGDSGGDIMLQGGEGKGLLTTEHGGSIQLKGGQSSSGRGGLAILSSGGSDNGSSGPTIIKTESGSASGKTIITSGSVVGDVQPGESTRSGNVEISTGNVRNGAIPGSIRVRPGREREWPIKWLTSSRCWKTS